MGNKPSHSKYNENQEPWSLKVLVRIGVLVPGSMNEEKTVMLRIMNNKALRKQVHASTMWQYRQYKRADMCRLIIPNDWEDYSDTFRKCVNLIAEQFNINWFQVALTYCTHNFDYNKTWESCNKHRRFLPQRDTAPFDNDPEANPWYFMNKYLNLMETVPSFANHIAATEEETVQSFANHIATVEPEVVQ